MNKLILAKCSNILKDPYNPTNRNPFLMLKNNLLTFMNLRNFENYFVDFSHQKFPIYAKQIFEEVGYGLKNGNIDLFSRNLNENVYFALRDEKFDLSNKNVQEDYLLKSFTSKTSDWKIVSARTLYLDDLDFSQVFAQITLKYKTEEKDDNYIVYERIAMNNFSFYHWKIFILNYNYYKK